MDNDFKQENIRNIAIIAHVDHGKTTLVDAFLKQSHLFRDNQSEMSQDLIMDSGELEKEKGITIKAKNLAIEYKGYKINVIDTPGHADFGGEVERTLNMADGCILLVDAQEGVMPQTKFVLKKALELNLQPILVINKIDKKFANPVKVLSHTQDLFLNLATNDSHLDFPTFYAIGREGKVFSDLPEGDLTIPNSLEGNIEPLLDAIIKYVPSPKGDINLPFQMQVSSIEFDKHLGRFLIGKINRGIVKMNDPIILLHNNSDKKETGNVKKIMVRKGLEFIEVQSAICGDIAAIAGINSTSIGATLCNQSNPEKLPSIKITEPSVKIKFEANTSPFVGKDGKYVTAKLLEQRLEQELETNISLKIEKSSGSSYFVAGRGELQLSILIETLRREGFEFQIRRPEVIMKEIDGVLSEPLEELTIDTPQEYIGKITNLLSERKAELVDMQTEDNKTRFVYKILTRNLIGLRNVLMTDTKGQTVINNYLLDYVPYTQQPEIFRRGVLIASESGVSKGYALNTIQERGELFIGPSVDVYEGMVVGINKFENDMDVNVTKERHRSGVRINQAEINLTMLKATIPLTLEFALVFLAKDEILEVTPNHLRLRKQYLTKNERVWSKRENLNDYAKEQLGV